MDMVLLAWTAGFAENPTPGGGWRALELPQGGGLPPAPSCAPRLPAGSSALLAVSSLQALTAADLNLVLYVCETVDTQQVFGQHPCPLSQPVLLSLIQQLSSDLGTRTELKLK